MVEMSEFDKVAITKKKSATKSIRMKHRFLNQIYAFAWGYFWIPCPVCGKMFGGHEHADGCLHTIPSDEPHIGYVICPDCARDGMGARC